MAIYNILDILNGFLQTNTNSPLQVVHFNKQKHGVFNSCKSFYKLFILVFTLDHRNQVQHCLIKRFGRTSHSAVLHGICLWSETNKRTHTHKQKPKLYIKQFKMYFNAYNKNNTLNKNQ